LVPAGDHCLSTAASDTPAARPYSRRELCLRARRSARSYWCAGRRPSGRALRRRKARQAPSPDRRLARPECGPGATGSATADCAPIGGLTRAPRRRSRSTGAPWATSCGAAVRGRRRWPPGRPRSGDLAGPGGCSPASQPAAVLPRSPLGVPDGRGSGQASGQLGLPQPTDGQSAPVAGADCPDRSYSVNFSRSEAPQYHPLASPWTSTGEPRAGMDTKLPLSYPSTEQPLERQSPHRM
jgi:hypothetical protein